VNAAELLALVAVGAAGVIAAAMAWKDHVVAAFWTFFLVAVIALSAVGAR